MKYFAVWQRLVDEDHHTALLLGFMRHAPREAALNPWLSEVLGRPVEAESLSPTSFWPKLPSVMEGASWTEPELVFAASDPEPLLVVVEVKPGFGGFTLDQIKHEVIDTVAARSPQRVVALMVSADLACPVPLAEWEQAVRDQLASTLPGVSVAVELVYSSFASIGRTVAACGATRPEWKAYADDVIEQLRRKGLLDYEGAPMLDDLEALTIPNAVEVFNRAMRAARKFYLQLHGQSRFEALGLLPFYQQGYRMWRNPSSAAPTQDERWFQTNVIVSLYKQEGWPETEAIFVNFDFVTTGETPDLCVGACRVAEGGIVDSFGWGERDKPPINAVLAASGYTHSIVQPPYEWVFERRPWLPGDGDADVKWALDQLEQAAAVWPATA